MLNDDGGVIDDLIVYRLTRTIYFWWLTLPKLKEDFLWLSGHRAGEVTLLNRSDHFAAVAVQGPKSSELFRPIGELRIATESKPIDWERSSPGWSNRIYRRGRVEAFFR